MTKIGPVKKRKVGYPTFRFFRKPMLVREQGSEPLLDQK